jgi:two-component system chemotaxis sensor kinase CheA
MDSNALKNEFLVESFENLSSINEDLTSLEKDSENSALINKVYRTVHTMKGSSSFLGYKKLQDLTHSAENLLDELREKVFSTNPAIIDTLLQSFDLCSLILKSIEANDNEGDVDVSQNKKDLDQLVAGKGILKTNDIQTTTSDVVAESSDFDLGDLIASHKEVSDTTSESEEGISSAAMDSLKELVSAGKMDADLVENLKVEEKSTDQVEVDGINNAAMDSLKELISEGKMDAGLIDDLQADLTSNNSVVPEQKEVTPSIADTPKTVVVEEQPKETIKETKTVISPPSKTIADSFVRVNVKVLDKIMNIVGELVLNRNQIVQFSNIKSDNELSKLSQQLNIITSELQSEVMTTRMQPLSSILTKFERLVRDFSRQSDKQIELKLFGQETELDKTLIEAIKDPLVHIIRNACDHGLEPVHERELNGKPGTGSVTIKAYNESGQVTIEISDNGRGLAKEKILKKAIEKGLITQDRAESMADAQIYGLIFEPGFSTAEQVTNISGRGVGMDVVRTNIEKIGGSVSINSELTVGTTFKLRIPLTLAIIPALIIKCAHESFAIPQLNLVELVRLEGQEEKNLIENIQGSEFFKLRGKLTPVFRLDKELNLKHVHQKTTDLMSICEETPLQKTTENNFNSDLIESTNIVILNTENHYFGIIVDEILDTEEVVVKSLSNSLKGLNLYGGATIMGDGKVALILDALGFFNSVSDSSHSTSSDTLSENSALDDENGEVQENLLFRLADDRVYAVPLSLVARLEEFEVSRIEMTGKQPVLRYLNAPMPLIDIEGVLKLDGDSVLKSAKAQGLEEMKCIVVTIAGRNFGIVVKDVLDISINKVEIDDIAVDRAGILGTIFINDKIISLIDLYSILESLGLSSSEKIIEIDIKDRQSKKILVVDDSPMYRKLESDTLLELGYQVDVGNHGEHGIELYKNGNYDLIITDIEMPILNGYEFAQKIRTELNDQSTPIIALSTRFSEKDKEKGRGHGFSFHLEKFKRNEVINIVNKILHGE